MASEPDAGLGLPTEEVRTVMANCHQGDASFGDFAGTQCTAVAFMAILMSIFFVPIHQWGDHDIRQAITQGSHLHSTILQTQHVDNASQRIQLLHSELPNELTLVNGMVANVNTMVDNVFGVVRDDRAGYLTDIGFNINEAFAVSFALSSTLLVTFGGSTVAIFYCDDQYMIFDSHARDHVGRPSAEGSAVILKFWDLEAMLVYIKTNYHEMPFEISPIKAMSTTSTTKVQSNSSAHSCSSDISVERNIHLGSNSAQTKSSSDSDHNYYKRPLTHNSNISTNETQCKSNRLSNSFAFDHLYHINSDIDMMPNPPTYDSLFQQQQPHCLQNHSYCTGEDTDVNQLFHSHMSCDNFSVTDTGHNFYSTCSEDIFNESSNYTYGITSYAESNDRTVQFAQQCCVSCEDSLHHDSFPHVIIPQFLSQTTGSNNSSTNTNSTANTAVNSQCTLKELSSVKHDNNVNCKFKTFIAEQMSETCSVCNRILYPSVSKKVNFDNDASEALHLDVDSIICASCYAKCKKNCIPPLAYVYNVLDPGEIPQELQGLWVIEKRLVSLIQVFLTIVLLPGNQLSQHGLAINLPVDLDTQTNDFFSGVCNYQSIMKVVCERPNSYPTVVLARPSAVREALLWLKSYNHLYSAVTIPMSVMNADTNDNISDVIREEIGTVAVNHSSSHLNNNQYANLPILTSQPINLKNTISGESKTFPWLYPYGRASLHADRPLRITDTQYFQSRIYNRDSRWRCDIPYLMVALNILEYERLCSSVQIYMRTCKTISSRPLTGESQLLPYSAGELLNINTNSDIQSQSYMFTKSIRGTAAYWRDVLHKLLAMIQSLGPPDFFLTLSCNDNWPELKEALQQDSQSGTSTIQNNPFVAAFAFQRRWQGLLTYVLKSPNSPLGNLKDFFIRVEFQNRGSPHLHIFIWSSLGLDVNTASTTDVVNLINQTISSTIPSADIDREMHQLVNQFQVHHHTFTCTKGRQNFCRFHFPHPPCTHTRLLYNADTIATRRGRFYETYRLPSDSMVNFYNPAILRYWRANMDLQIVGNIQSCAYYVFKYACKAEPEDLTHALRSMFTNDAFWSLPIKTQKFRIGIEVLRSRKISAQEAIYRLCGMKLYSTSRTFLNLNTFPPQQRYKLLRPVQERMHLSETCTNEHDLFQSNILDYYRARPVTLNHSSFYHFASHYKIVNANNTTPLSRTTYFQLNEPYNSKYAQSRLKIVIIQPTYCRQNTQLFYYSSLLLYFPHRSEADLLSTYNDYETAFLHQQHRFDVNSIRMQNQEVILENAVRRIRLLMLDTSSNHNITMSESTPFIAPDYASLNIPKDISPNSTRVPPGYDINNTSEQWHDLTVLSVDTQTLENRIRNLSTDQQHVFDVIKQHYTSWPNQPTPLRVFITGGGGTGKSYLLQVIADYLRLCHPKVSNNDPVIIAAPTGVAARNIHGVTLHYAFRLPVQHGYESSLHTLSPRTLKHLQSKMQTFHTIIIDEISMISAKTFTHIHHRLCSIANSTTPFGNYNIICFGDFFQLRPVRGHYLFTEPTLWHLFTPYFLQANMRQQNDSNLIEVLNAIRLGHVYPHHLQLLLERHISNFPDVDLSAYLHIFPTIKEAQLHNSNMQARLNPDYITHDAQHVFSSYDPQAGSTPPDNLIPSDDRDAGGLPHQLKISVATRVMLLRNLLTSQGLVNGAMGYVHDITIQNAQIITIYVKFDEPTTGVSMQNPEHNNSVPIEMYRQEFTYQGRNIERIQFPLQPCWACTVHKTQGLTLNTACISIGRTLFQAGQAYVALSRVRSMSTLYIIDLSPSKIYADDKVISEYSRLHDHENS